ncbi:MAG: hypothetical protein V4458_06380 [Pseudomonadota bacterium]|nr:hypothetical protein [Afipia sp.]
MAIDDEMDEYLNLPDDPEEAFAVFQRRRYKELEATWGEQNSGWHNERRYVDSLLAFDEVHGLDILIAFRSPPGNDVKFSDFFQEFRRHAEISSQKILIERARRIKSNAETVILLDAKSRTAIHKLIDAIREKLNELKLPEDKRDSLFKKLNLFAVEVDLNRTRTTAFFAFAVEAARTGKAINDEIKPLQQTIDRVFDWIDKATKWKDALPPWSERKKIEGPRKQLPAPKKETDGMNDDIPF